MAIVGTRFDHSYGGKRACEACSRVHSKAEGGNNKKQLAFWFPKQETLSLFVPEEAKRTLVEAFNGSLS